MPSQLVSSSGCCQPCDSEPVVVNIPGPQGAAGTNGTNGTNGVDSFSYTTAQFFVPALGSSVVVPLSGTSFLPESVAGQFFVSIQGVGYMQVTDVTGLNVTLKNPSSGVLGIPNAVPTTSIPSGSLVTLAGGVGPQGAPGLSGGAPYDATYIVRTANVSLPSATALDSLMPGYVKTQGSVGFGAVSTVSSVPVADISGTLPISKGGTNLTTIPTNGQLLIGNGTGYTLAQLTGGSGITITPGAGSISIASTAGPAFSYVTFTRRVLGTSTSVTAPRLVGAVTQNPYNATTFSGAAYDGIDTASGFAAANGKFTVPFLGYYRIDAYFNLQAETSASSVIVEIRKNGASVLTSKAFTVQSSGYHPISINYIDNATNLTDFYEVYVTTTQSTWVDQGSSFSVQRIQA